MARQQFRRFPLPEALRSLALMLCCVPVAGYSFELTWEIDENIQQINIEVPDRLEPQLSPPPPPTPVTSRLQWEADIERPTLVADDTSPQPISSELVWFADVESSPVVAADLDPQPTSSGLVWVADDGSTPAVATNSYPQTIASGLVWVADDEPMTLIGADPTTDLLSLTAQPSYAHRRQKVSAQPLLLSESLRGLLLASGFSRTIGDGIFAADVAKLVNSTMLGRTTSADKGSGEINSMLSNDTAFNNNQQPFPVQLPANTSRSGSFTSNSYDVALSRMLLNQPRLQEMIAGGLLNEFTFRDSRSNQSIPDPTGFGLLTMALPLREQNSLFNQVLQISVGVGGRDASLLGTDFSSGNVSVSGAKGMELTPNFGSSARVSYQVTNLNLSYIPSPDLPIAINLLAADIFNQSPFGTAGVLTVSWGNNSRRPMF